MSDAGATAPVAERNRNCPRCGCAGSALLAALPARSFCAANSTYRTDWAELLALGGDESYPLCRCEECRFVYAGWLPAPDFLERVYDRVIDEERGRRESLSYPWMARQLRIVALLLDRAQEAWGLEARGRSVLDIGCSYGTQLRTLALAGFDVLGVDSSARVRDFLEPTGVRCVPTVEHPAVADRYDVILLNEVLEHLADFREALRFVRERLADDGFVWISVPDFSDWRLDRALREIRAGRLATRELNPWEHLNYFTPQSLREIVAEMGFREVERSEVIEGAGDAAPGWRRPGRAVARLRATLRWLVRGAPRRTDLLVEKTSAGAAPRSEQPAE